MVIKRIHGHKDGLELGIDMLLKTSMHWLHVGESPVFSSLGKNYHHFIYLMRMSQKALVWTISTISNCTGYWFCRLWRPSKIQTGISSPGSRGVRSQEPSCPCISAGFGEDCPYFIRDFLRRKSLPCFYYLSCKETAAAYRRFSYWVGVGCIRAQRQNLM